MDDRLARAFRERWQAVAAIEVEEQRAASVGLRWQQMNVIWLLAMGLGLPLEGRDEAEDEAVRQRWARLRGVQL